MIFPLCPARDFTSIASTRLLHSPCLRRLQFSAIQFRGTGCICRLDFCSTARAKCRASLPVPNTGPLSCDLCAATLCLPALPTQADKAMDLPSPVERYREWLQDHAAISLPLEIGLSILACCASQWEGEMSILAEASYAAVGLFTLLNESVFTNERTTTQRGERLVLSALDKVGKLFGPHRA